MTLDELVEELREMGEHPCRAHLPMGATLREAATRIEALEAALRECATAYNGYAAQIIAKQALESKP